MMVKCFKCKGNGYLREVLTNPPDGKYQLLIRACVACDNGYVTLRKWINQWIMRFIRIKEKQ